jgi:hypothetical protein
VITLNAPLTLRASNLPLPPPPAPPPVLIARPLSPSFPPSTWYTGVFQHNFLDKNYWHFTFAINPFCFSFSPLLHTRTFFAIPFAEKMHPFFLLIINLKILFSRFLLCYNFCSSLMNMPITYIKEIETALLNVFGRILGFIEGKGR